MMGLQGLLLYFIEAPKTGAILNFFLHKRGGIPPHTPSSLFLDSTPKGMMGLNGLDKKT